MRIIELLQMSEFSDLLALLINKNNMVINSRHLCKKVCTFLPKLVGIQKKIATTAHLRDCN